MRSSINRGYERGRIMNIVFRADASIQIGSGHVMRCLTLATMLREQNHCIFFLSQVLPGNFNSLIQRQGFEVIALPDEAIKLEQEKVANILKKINPEWLVIDHYDIDIQWEKFMRPFCQKIMVIDDMANRKHDCDLLLDQNLQLQSDRYKNLVSTSCELLLGTKFFLLRSEFLTVRQDVKERSFLKNIFVFFGGGNCVDIIEKVLNGILKSKFSGMINVVLGKNNSKAETIEKNFTQKKFIFFYREVDNMAYLMNQADLCIGAGGTNSWERCFLGLPSLIIITAENQISIATALAAMNAAQYLGNAKKVSAKLISTAINAVILNSSILNNLSENAKNLVDGGGTERVMKKIMSEIYLRKATLDDVTPIFKLRNHPVIRKNSFSSEEIIFSKHETWFNNVLQNSARQLLIANNFQHELVGVVRFDFEENFTEVSIYVNPDMHGRGYGTKILSQGIEWIVKNYRCNRIIAKVKAENIASQKLFLKTGFVKKNTYFEKIIKNGITNEKF